MPGPSVGRVDLVRVRLPLLQPHRAAHGTEQARDSILVRVEVAGVVGWGECATPTRPGYVAETTDRAWRSLRQTIVPALLDGGEVPGPGEGMAASAVACALHDAHLRGQGRSLADHLGVGPHVTVPAGAVVGRPHRHTVEEVAGLLAQGYHRVKVKVGPGDVEALERIRSELPGAPLSVDANGSFDPDDPDHVAQMEAIDGLGLVCIEQPFPASATAEAGRLQERLTTPVALDEPFGSAADVRRVAEQRLVRQACLKPARLGGAEATVAAAAAARPHGMEVWVGSMMETAVGRAVAVVAAAAVDGPVGDVGPSSRHFADDLAEPVVMTGDGRLALWGGPGASPEPDEAALRRFAVDRWRAGG